MEFPKTFLVIWFASCFLGLARSETPVLLYSFFSWGGLRGNVTFSWNGPGTEVAVELSLESAGVGAPSEAELDWGIYEFPVRQDLPNRCEDYRLGKREFGLSEILGNITLPISGVQVYSTKRLSMVGERSIWGKSLRISDGKRITCGIIQGFGDEKTYLARFHTPVGGTVWIRTWSWQITLAENKRQLPEEFTSGTQFLILTDTFNVDEDEPESSQHRWNLYITDIIDDGRYRASCNFLSTIYDDFGPGKCKTKNTKCLFGEFTRQFGKLTVQPGTKRDTKRAHFTTGRPLLDLSGPRQLFIGIEDDVLKNSVYACAKLNLIEPKIVQSFFNWDGVSGKVLIKQNSPFEPTELTLHLQGLAGQAGGFHVHELPITSPLYKGHKICSDAAGHYNPYKVDPGLSPIPGFGSHDQYELGDLSGKHGLFLGLDHISTTVLDQNLPLFGPRSVVGRSLVIHYEKNGQRWVCSNLRPEKPVIRAVALFRYPFVGEIIMEQSEDDPESDTTVFVGPLLYSDGSHNDTFDHQWMIHNQIPDKDFYDWQNRCRSAKEVFNPYRVSTTSKVYKSCGRDNQLRCFVGDLHGKHAPLSVAGSTASAAKTRKVFTDSNLPLSGPTSIFKHSIVVYNKDAPKHRGNRTACIGIFRHFRYKAVVNTWSTEASNENNLEGKLEFIQESPYDITNTEVDLRGLEGLASGYHVHMVPVLQDLAFPCANAVLYGHFNPLNVSLPFPPQLEATFDNYELGDLSSKYGALDGRSWLREFYNDTNLPLFGPNSILGRSVVVHKKQKNERWYCGNIGFGYSPSEARQVSAIASFHNPKGYAWGYVRFRQLIYLDGAQSETYIEVNLRHPGSNDKNVTRGHNWSIYVNPVGVDASVKYYNSRCVASGYRWNPFLIQLAHPNDKDYYDKQCTPEFPYRCDVGDLSGRLGPIDLGDKRQVFMDKNLPLAGEHSAMKRAIVIHESKGRVERFACANIAPDYNLVKWSNIRKTSRFSATIFMNDMREILGATEWFLAIDYQTITYSADQRCVSFKTYFMGPWAHQLEQDFSRLLAGGILERPTVTLPGIYPPLDRKKKVSYRSCGGFEDEDLEKFEKGKNWWDFASTAYSEASHIKPTILYLYVFISITCANVFL